MLAALCSAWSESNPAYLVTNEPVTILGQQLQILEEDKIIYIKCFPSISTEKNQYPINYHKVNMLFKYQKIMAQEVVKEKTDMDTF